MITRIHKEKTIKAILFAALIAAIVLPLYNIFFIYPSFKEQLVENIQEDAVQVAAHLSSVFIREGEELQKDALLDDLDTVAQKVKRDFNLWKMKMISPSGEVIYSTDSQEIGTINKHKYFHEIVAKGKVHSVIVKKDTLSLEGQKISSHVVETYVPIMRNGKFLGAIEVYYDITKRRQDLEALINHYSLVLSLIGILSITLVLFLFKANKDLIAEKVRWDITFDSIKDPIAIIDRNHRLVRINKAMADKLKISKDEATGLKCYEAVHGKYEPILHCPHTKLLSDGQAHTEEVYEERLGGWYLVSISPIYERRGKLIGSVHIAYDISPRKKAEEDLKQAYEELTAKNRHLEQFQNITVDRELRMIELKEEVNSLLEKLGQPKKYDI